MEFKGFLDFSTANQKIKKITETAIGKSKSVIISEYFFKNEKLIKHIDYINWVISHHKYDSNGLKTELRTFGFSDTPNNAKLEGYKTFKYKDKKLTNETFYLEKNGKIVKEYDSIKIYQNNNLIEEIYHYSDESYYVKYEYSDSENKLLIRYPNNNGNNLYFFDSNGFVIKYYYFKYKESCKFIKYSYENEKIKKFVEYPYLIYNSINKNGEPEFFEKPTFIHESEYFYNSKGNIEKVTKTDTLNEVLIEEIIYKYE